MSCVEIVGGSSEWKCREKLGEIEFNETRVWCGTMVVCRFRSVAGGCADDIDILNHVDGLTDC